MGPSRGSVGRKIEGTEKVGGPEIKQWAVRQKKRRKLDDDSHINWKAVLNEYGRSERIQSFDMSHLGHFE